MWIVKLAIAASTQFSAFTVSSPDCNSDTLFSVRVLNVSDVSMLQSLADS